MRLGVDFGTTRTTVAQVDRGNYPVVAFDDDNGDVQEYIPSVAALDGDRLVYGFRALHLALEGAPHLRSFKRLLADPEVTPATTVRLGNRDIGVLRMITGFLAHVAQSVRTGSSVSEVPAQEPLEAVIGIPAHAYSAQRFLTLEAFRDADFEVLAMVNEPSAAGFEYTHRHGATINTRRRRVLVYDLGGGTFDVSLVSVDGTSHEVLGSRGNNLLGGDDFDEVLARLAAEQARTSPADLGEVAWQSLVDSARSAKESLNPRSHWLTLEVAGEPVTVDVAHYYEAVEPLIASTVTTMEPLTQRLDDGTHGLAADVAGLYVVGGGSELPAITRQLRLRFGRRVHRSPHSAASTAIGLAIAADPDAGYTLRDQLSRGVGVFRERESGAVVSFDTLLSPELRVSTSQAVSVSRTYRAAHNIGWFRFVEYTTTDDEGVPRGDVLPYGEIAFPFDPLLQGLGSSVPLADVEVRRTEDGPMVRERYTVDPHGIVEVSITDLGTGYSLTRSLGELQD